MRRTALAAAVVLAAASAAWLLITLIVGATASPLITLARILTGGTP